MDDEFIKKLRKKGWSNIEISHALSLINKSEQYKNTSVKRIDAIAYWSSLFIAIIGNLIISIILIPFLVLLQNLPLYFIIIVIALAFGFLFQLLIKDIQKISSKNNIVLDFFIPAIALINIFYMTNFSNYLSKTFNLPLITHNPLAIGILYVAFFSLPYFIIRITRISS